MKYYLKVNDVELKNVSALEIQEAYRNETISYSLGGTTTVERVGTAKLHVNAKVNMIDSDEMKTLKNAVQLATNTVCEFYQNDKLVSKNMRVLPFTEPSPLYFFGDREQGYIYGSVELEMEEV